MEYVHKTITNWGVCTLCLGKDRYNLFPPPPLERPTARPSGEWGKLEDLDANLKGRGGNGVYQQARLFPGQYHPRIWRGNESPLPEEAGLGHAFIESLLICNQMASQLREIFYYVHPDQRHLDVYGHRPRELTLLACTELESAWRRVFLANRSSTPSGGSDRLSTNDYVRLNVPMRLHEWSVELVRFPQFGPLRPFSTWDPQRPTASIAWYDAYNAIKHDREGAMHRATLGHAINAVAAMHIMVAAQFGLSALVASPSSAMQEFRVVGDPQWPLEEYYTRPMTGFGDTPGEHLGYETWTESPLGI